MRWMGGVGILCVIVAPAMGTPADYVFDVTSASVQVDVTPDGIADPDPFTGAGAGTFAMTVYQSNGHIGQSDTFLLGDASIANPEEVVVSLLGGAVTARVPAGSAAFVGFDMSSPAHIEPGGSATAIADIHVAGTVFVTGFVEMTFESYVITPDAELDVTFTTSAAASDVVTVTLGGTFDYLFPIGEISQTITLDIIISVVGTAHVIPDPAVGGLAALGLGGAGAWLRRRRRGE